MAMNFDEAPVAAKSPPPPAEKKPHIALLPFPCEITSVRAKAKKIEVTLVLDDFPIIDNSNLNPVFGRVDKNGKVEDSAFATFGHLHKEGRILLLSGETVNLKEG